MSAICGIIESNGVVRESLLSRVRDAMAHRGPDDQGLYVSRDKKVGLAHRSLATAGTDPSAPQPMSNEDGTIWATCDGVIYNALELRKSLARREHTFRSPSGTEAILHLYEERGEAFPSELDGDFALGLWDANNHVFYLVRDRIGKHPLYYSWDGSTLVFASALKAITEHPGVSREIDPLALDAYLTLRYVPCPRTIFKGIKKLPPGHMLRFKGGQISSLVYWRLAPEPNGYDKEDSRHEASVLELLQDSVKRRLPSDVPAGVLLSGGLVSSTLVGILSQSGNGTVRTFSVGLSKEEDEDLHCAERVSNHFGTSHETIFIDRQPACDLIPNIAGRLDEPLATVSAVPAYLISSCLRGTVKVCLSGEGGRELFGDPTRHRLAFQHQRLADSLAVGNEALEDELRQALSPSLRDYAEQTSTFSLQEKERLLQPEWKVEVEESGDEGCPHLGNHCLSWRGTDFLSRLQYMDMQTSLPDDLLATMDQTAMLASLDVRLPLLDPKLIQTALALPHRLKNGGGIDKYVLRRIMAKVLPKDVLWRPNRSFVFPLTRVFSNDLESYARDLLLGSEASYFRKATLNALFRENWMESHDGFAKIWALVVFEEWRRACNP